MDLRTLAFYAVAFVVLFVAGFEVAHIGDVGQILKLSLFVAAAVVAVVSLRLPRVALYGALIAAVFDRTLTVLGLEVHLVTVALVLFAPALARMWRPGLTSRTTKFGTWCLLGGSTLATVLATDWRAAVIGTVNWALVLNLVMGGLGIIGRDARQLRTLATWLVVLGATVGVLGWFQEHGIYTIVGPSYAPNRIDSSFGYFTNFANFEALAMVVAVGLLLYAISERARGLAWVAAGCAIVTGWAVMASLSRGAILLVVCGGAVMLLTRLRRPPAFIAAGVILPMIGWSAWILTPPDVRLEFLRRFTQLQGGDVVRHQLQAVGADILQQQPTGIGFDNFRRLVASGAVTADLALAHSHNLFIQIGLDAGWLGLFGFSLLVLAASLRGVRIGFVSDSKALQSVFCAALIGYLVQGTQDYFFFETGSLVMFSVLVLGALTPLGVAPPSLSVLRETPRASGFDL